MKKRDEINIQDYLDKAKSYVGTEHKLWFQSSSKYGQQAGTFTIEKFEPHEEPYFGFNHWKYKEGDTPSELYLGLFSIALHGCKQNAEKTFRFEVCAYFRDGSKLNNELFVSNCKFDEKKGLNAYKFGFLI